MVEMLDHELKRLKALYDYDLINMLPDSGLDRVTNLAAQVFDVPISLITLVDADRIWLKSRYGVNVESLPREPGLCASVILQDDVYIVEDAAEDPRSCANSLVTGPFGLRFYAGVPIKSADGYALGTMNIIDTQPRELLSSEVELLRQLGAMVMDHLELRRATRMSIESLSQMVISLRHDEEFERLVTVCAWTNKLKLDGEWFSFEEFLSKKLGMKISHGLHPEALEKIVSEAFSDVESDGDEG